MSDEPTGVAQVIGAPLAAGLLYMDGLGGLRGWQWLFIIEGLVTSIYGILLKVRPLPGFPAAEGALCWHGPFQAAISWSLPCGTKHQILTEAAWSQGIMCEHAPHLVLRSPEFSCIFTLASRHGLLSYGHPHCHVDLVFGMIPAKTNSAE